MATQADLQTKLRQLDGHSYKAYKSIRGDYAFDTFTLTIDYVQGDPFAAPSQLQVKVPQAVAGFPAALYSHPSRAIALQDYLTRQFDRAAQSLRQKRGSGKSGLISVMSPGQVILARTTAFVTPETVELRFVAGLPAFGRRIAGHQAAAMLCGDLPELVDRALFYRQLQADQLSHHVNTAEDADWLRSQLSQRGLVAFVADGAVLPRRSGVDDRPLTAQVTPFRSPDSLQVAFDCPHAGRITGMGIPKGISLIVGGGYHGKSTLLRAIEQGIYNHVPSDGRQQVVTDPGAVKIRAEDGRSVTGVDISPFISHLPQNRSTQHFSTPNASGSTSQAASIIEAVEAGATVLLVDEDTAATNFMIRDRRMQALIAKEKEPITPFIDKIQSLYTDYGVSTILVMGGSGDYFDVADTVIALDSYQPAEVTKAAKAIAAQYATDRAPEGGEHFGTVTQRVILPASLDASKGRREVSLKVRDIDELRFGTEAVDLAAVEQLIEPGQVRAIAAAMVYAQRHYFDGKQPLATVLDAVMQDLERQGLDILSDRTVSDFSSFRRFELAAAINRVRSLQVEPA
ncbi:MAG: ABC-ATPase domain-containing protein [Leptolyngbya sp. SIO4C5]|nr:ABC-ATPase domain-containing protein [Leptolyngbya sp. SIO4C5]